MYDKRCIIRQTKIDNNNYSKISVVYVFIVFYIYFYNTCYITSYNYR